MGTDKYPVIILAGGPTPDSILASGETEPERAFIPVAGRPMLAWVLDAIRGCDACGQVVCIGNAQRLERELGLPPNEVIPQLDSLLENFVAGLERFRDHPRVLVATCDIPLVTSEALSDLARQVSEVEAEVYYPIIDVKIYDEKYPGGKRTTQKIKEGTFTGGNVFVLNPDAVLRNRDRIETVIRDRKSPAKLARLFGLSFILRYLMNQLDLKGLEAKATKILGARMRGIITPHPEIGLDVDKPEDLLVVRDVLGHA